MRTDVASGRERRKVKWIRRRGLYHHYVRGIVGKNAGPRVFALAVDMGLEEPLDAYVRIDELFVRGVVRAGDGKRVNAILEDEKVIVAIQIVRERVRDNAFRLDVL